VGTGGPEGGPTGLFTIYDGSTIRKGEFTFSFAYSSYARDPGDANFTDLPASFNVGLNDHIELFFKTNAYRGLKINSQGNLSGFYLPNIGVCGPSAFCSGAAIVLSPTGSKVGSNLPGNGLFRPFNNQPFVQFPFVGGSAGNFGQGGINFPGFSAQLGPAILGNGSTFNRASSFPGIGSPVGSILPGIVFTTSNLPITLVNQVIQVPATYTVDPSYLPDAPFIGRTYGQSTFNDFVVGAKIRLTGPNNPLGVALIPFYRWYPDTANSAGGFTQLQRGAGPGAQLGDFGLVLAVDGRLSKHVNVSANVGFILDSNPKSDLFGATGAVLLDRPNEFLAGIGFDFPINKYFQPIVEVRDTQYVGGHTPNAFANNPVEFLAGAKIYPRRWWGFGVWYRMQVNQQSSGRFTVSNATVPVTVVVPGGGTFTVAGASGVATGFRFSDNPNGFGGQFFIGHRNPRWVPKINGPPVIRSFTPPSSITLPCREGESTTCPTTANMQVQLTVSASDPDNDTLLYTYTVTGGRITGQGANVTWDLTGVTPGTYTASVEVNDGNGHTVPGSTTVTVADCPDCKIRIICPPVNASGQSTAKDGDQIKFDATVGGSGSYTYNWSVSAGKITGGQGSVEITVDTTGTGGQTITATVEIGGLDPSCGRTASASTAIAPILLCHKFDEYGNIRFNDEKARLDNFAIQLQNEPTSQGYIVAYGACDDEGQKRADRAKAYLVNTRSIDASRITVINGGCMPELKVELWLCPSGATAPTPSTDGAVSPCPDCKNKPVRRRPRRGSSDDDREQQ
jgi:hypothetical protein